MAAAGEQASGRAGKATSAPSSAVQPVFSTREALLAVIAAFIALSLGYALNTPPWNNPDEPAHYNYVRHVATTGSLPVLQEGDWDAQRLEYLKTYHFPPGESIASIRYEAHQPPLYYLLAAPVFLAAQPFGEYATVIALRGLSILFGALLVLVSYHVALAAFLPRPQGDPLGRPYGPEPRAATGGRPYNPDSPPPPSPHSPIPESSPARGRPQGAAPTSSLPSLLPTSPPHVAALLAAGLVAFVPMHTAMSAAINNDALANLLSGLMLLLALRGVQQGFTRRGVLLLGVVAGAMVLTKLTTYGVVAVGLGVLALVQLRDAGGWKQVSAWVTSLWSLGLALLAALLVSGWWLARQGLVYGWNDILAAQRHDQVVVGQPRWSDLGIDPLAHFVETLFQSFWAQFGWMAILVDERLYQLFGLFGAFVLLGLALRLGVIGPTWLASWRGRRASEREAERKAIDAAERSTGALSDGWRIGILLAVAAVVLAEVVYYNLSLVQPQGRYLFPALGALGALAALGWYNLAVFEQAGRALAVGWLTAALLEGGGLLIGDPLSGGMVYGAAIAVGAGLAIGLPPRIWPALRLPLVIGPLPALALLNLISLTQHVRPGFA